MSMACRPPLLALRWAMISRAVAPNLVDNVMEEFGNATFGCLVAGMVFKAGFVGGLGTNTEDSRGIVGDVPVVKGKA
jgi:hypothetical protein